MYVGKLMDTIYLLDIIHCPIMYHVDYSFESKADDEATDQPTRRPGNHAS